MRQIEAVYSTFDSADVSSDWENLLPHDDPNEAAVHEAVNNVVATRATWQSKCAGVLKTLLDAAQGTFGSSSPGTAAPTSVLNPTAGVSNSKTVEMVSGLRFRPDPNRAGGGVFVADKGTSVAKDLPNGTVIKNGKVRPVCKTSDPTATGKRSATSPPLSKKRKAAVSTGENMAMKVSPTLLGGELHDEPQEWPINWASLTQVLASGTTTDSNYKTQHLPQAKLVTSIPMGSTYNLHSGSQADPANLAHDTQVPLLRTSGADAEHWAPNLNPNLNDGVWNASLSFLFEAPERIFDGHQSLNPAEQHHSEPNQGTNMASFDMNASDPTLLGALPQSLEVLDFDAWSTWGARLVHGTARPDQSTD